MKDKTPAMNAAKRVTFSIIRPASVVWASGPLGVGAAGSELGSSAPLTGGRSWNRKSHFQRSDGFDICSHVRAATGRLNIICCSAPYCLKVEEISGDFGARTIGRRELEVEQHPDIRKDRAVVLSIAGRCDHGRRSLDSPLVICIRRIFFKRGRARQHEVGSSSQFRVDDALHDQ